MMSNKLKWIILLGSWLLALGSTKAQDSKSLFQTANTYYQNKQYEEAEKLYLLLIKKDKKNANAFYNLGNTYYHLKKYASAVLYYEKAKKLEPESKYLQHNINLTNNKLFSKIEFSKEFFVTKKLKGFAYTKSSNSWSIYMLSAFWLAVLLVCIHFFYGKKLAFRIGIVLLLISGIFAWFTYLTHKSENNQDFAIVMQENAYYKTAPVESMNAATAIQQGTKVQIIDSDKNWWKIKLPNDKTGWIERRQIELI